MRLLLEIILEIIFSPCIGLCMALMFGFVWFVKAITTGKVWHW